MTRRTVFAALLIVLGFTGFTHAADKLADAYKKEFAFLESEKTALQKRLAEHDAAANAAVSAAKSDLGSLQAKLVGLTANADSLQDKLSDIERELEALQENTDTLDSTIYQATTTLGGLGAVLPEKAEGDGFDTVLGSVYASSLDYLHRFGSVRTEEGEFFLTDGRKSTGRVTHIGRIAAFGVSELGSGALAPAGDGMFKIWPASDAATAQAVDRGERPAMLSLFIFESLDKAIDEKVRQSLFQHIDSGGLIAWVIVVVGLAALAMIILRAIFLYRAVVGTESLVGAVTPMVEKGRVSEALDLCRSGAGATARVLQATLRNIERDRDHLEDIISESILHETPFLDRFGSAILVLAGVAPLLGLLGTVTGMISTFDVITEFGTGDPKLLSGGISEALITTELGLIVAIPALLAGNLLSGWAEKIKSAMENTALKVTNRYTALRGAAKD